MAVVFLLFLSLGCLEYDEEELYKNAINVTITGDGWREGHSRYHYWVYPTDAEYVLILPSEEEGLKDKNITLINHSPVYYNSEKQRYEVESDYIIVDGRISAWF